MKYSINNNSNSNPFLSISRYCIISIFILLCVIGENYSVIMVSIFASLWSALCIRFCLETNNTFRSEFLNILSLISILYIVFFCYDILTPTQVSCGNGCVASYAYGAHVLPSGGSLSPPLLNHPYQEDGEFSNF